MLPRNHSNITAELLKGRERVFVCVNGGKGGDIKGRARARGKLCGTLG
jgi:hypothetical protein